MLEHVSSFMKKEKGQALVELAFVLPILLLLVFGVIEFGSIYHTQLALDHASREAARIGAVRVASGDFDFDAEVTGLIQDRASYLDDDHLHVSVSPESTNERVTGADLEVLVEYEKSLMTPIMSRVLSNSDNPGHIQLSARTVMRIE